MMVEEAEQEQESDRASLTPKDRCLAAGATEEQIAEARSFGYTETGYALCLERKATHEDVVMAHQVGIDRHAFTRCLAKASAAVVIQAASRVGRNMHHYAFTLERGATPEEALEAWEAFGDQMGNYAELRPRTDHDSAMNAAAQRIARNRLDLAETEKVPAS